LIILALIAASAAPGSGEVCLRRPSDFYRDYGISPDDPPAPPGELSTQNVIEMGPQGTLRWNGQAINWNDLSRRLGEAKKLDPVPGLYLAHSRAAPCNVVRKVRHIMRISIGCGERRCREGPPRPQHQTGEAWSRYYREI